MCGITIIFISPSETVSIQLMDMVSSKYNISVYIWRNIMNIPLANVIAVGFRINQWVTYSIKIALLVLNFDTVFLLIYLVFMQYNQLIIYIRLFGDARIRSTPNSGKGTLTDLFELLISKFSSQKLYESFDNTWDVPSGDEATEVLGESKQYSESRNLSIGGSIVWDVTVNLGLWTREISILSSLSCDDCPPCFSLRYFSVVITSSISSRI